MTDARPGHQDASAPPPDRDGRDEHVPERLIDRGEYARAFGEPMERTLDIASWQPGSDLLALYSHLEDEVARAVEREDVHLAAIREQILPRIANNRRQLPDAGVYQATPAQLEAVHRSLLFSGGVEACDGTVAAHETLALTITQIGVCLVSYQGDQGTWGHRMFQRELRHSGGTAEEVADEAMALIERRQRGTGESRVAKHQRLSQLAQRGILAYAVRATLADRATAPWRLGHGNPIPFELLTGGGSFELALKSADLLRRLLLDHGRWVFVNNAHVERGLLTLGQALRPLQYAVLDTMQARLTDIVRDAHYAHRELLEVESFAMEAGPQVAIGVYRASEIAGPRLFYAHRDHVHEAALVALADSVLLEHRAFPMLLDLADQVCRGMFAPSDLALGSRVAYADAGAPWRLFGEQETRR